MQKAETLAGAEVDPLGQSPPRPQLHKSAQTAAIHQTMVTVGSAQNFLAGRPLEVLWWPVVRGLSQAVRHQWATRRNSVVQRDLRCPG